MPVTKKTIRLIAKSVEFTYNCIVYKVRVESKEDVFGVVINSNDIKHKDLILNPTIVDKDNMEVIFSTDNLTPHFYQSILNGTIRNLDDYLSEKDKIYLPGEVVGFVIQEVKAVEKVKIEKVKSNQLNLL